MAEEYERLDSFQFLDLIPVKKYRSKRTGINFCFAQVQGPLVNGFLCLATEAHDDDGLPHTLEHLVFMGSEKYPFKGVLDLLANRCLAQGTNAWTDTDHTCYTMETAGSEGFLNLLPIYLDHVLYPTLTESGYITEVHHVNGEGEDAGVVYCEMQGRENSGRSRAHLSFLREMFPGHCGCKSETGGIMKNLRTSCSHTKVCNYHRQFYRPENLCIIITGQIEPDKVFEVVKPFEDKILSKDPLPPYVKPWQDPIPSLPQPVDTRIQFPTEDESSGIVIVGCRGPKARDFYGITAVEVISEYLTDTSVAPLQRELVEISEPFCSDVGYCQIEFSESVLYIKANNVATEKLQGCKEKIQEVLAGIAEGKEAIDMKRMAAVIHRQILSAKEAIENKPHETLAFMAIGDILYSQKSEDFQERARKIDQLRNLAKEPAVYWANFVKNYFLSKSTVSIIAEPSAKLMEQMAETEKQRIEEQRKTFGDDGLKKLEEKLDKAKEENEVEPPPEMVSYLPVPSTASISFHPVKIFSNKRKDCSPLTEPEAVRFPVGDIPCAFQLSHVLSMFVEMTVTLNTAAVPVELKPFLSLYLEVIFESPVLRNGVLIPHEEIVTELAADTLDYGGSLGLKGSRFQPQDFVQLATITLQLEVEKYEKGVQWLHELLYKSQFTAARLEVVGKKMMNDVARMKREGRQVAKVLLNDIVHTKDSSYYSANMVRQYFFLEKLLNDLKSNPDKIIEKFNLLRDALAHPSNLQVFVSANVDNLPNSPHLPWKTKFLSDPSIAISTELCQVLKGSSLRAKDGVHGKIVGIGAVESSFMIQAAPCFDDYNHPDLAPLMVFLECLTTLEGPIWRQVRGLGLSYGYGIRVDPGQGLLRFALIKSTHVVKAYEKCKEIVDEYMSGKCVIDSVTLESAVSSVIFEIIDRERTVGSTAHQSVLSQFRIVGPDYNRQLLDKLTMVTIEDLTRVGRSYVAPLFNPAVSQCAICCHPSKVEEIKEGFNSLNKKLVVVQSLDEEFTWPADLLAKL